MCVCQVYTSENKALFDHLQKRAAALDEAYGVPLDWRRMPDKKVSIIEDKQAFDGHNRESWPAMIEWLVERVQRMERTFDPEIAGLRLLLRSGTQQEGGVAAASVS